MSIRTALVHSRRLLGVLVGGILSTLAAAPAADRVVVIQAESGLLGSDFLTPTDAAAGVTYITAGTDLNGSAGNQAPGIDTKVATYSITFPQAGTYNLYARLRVGPTGGGDDSFYYGNGFGVKSVSDGAQWILVNNTPAQYGYAAPTDTVLNGGTLGSGVWKWTRLSQTNFSETGPQFVVPDGALTQTFQFGTRENGLDVDQFVFGLATSQYTVANLQNTRPVLTGGQAFTAYEQAINGDIVGTVVATDVDPGTTFQAWTVTGGTGASVFAINASTGVVTVANAAAIDPTITPSYTLSVTVSDGIYTSVEETVTINVSSLATIAIIAQPANGVYKTADTLSFVVGLNSPMTVDTTGGVPRLALAVGSETRYANYVFGSGSNRLTFTAVIGAGDDDPDGIELVSPLDLNGGTIKDGANADIGLAFTPPNTSGIRIDSTPPAPPVIAAYNDATRTLTGTAEAASTVHVYLDANLSGTANTNALGNWTFVLNVTQLPAGNNALSVTATATDTSGNVSALSAGFPIVVVIDPNAPLIVQAESGTRGADFIQASAAGSTYITAATDLSTTPNAQSPGTAAKVATYVVTFPQGGTYDLYARVRVGGGGGSDDSFYYGNGFGTKNVTDPNAWITVNNINGIGFTAAGDWVTNAGSLWGGGGAGSNTFKWVKLSLNNTDELGIQFVVPNDARTQTFQVGSRENGLDLDQFAFGLDGLFFTVANLNGAQAGTTVAPPPPYDPTHPPLATGKPKFLGSAWSNAQSPNFDNYFNQVTPENAGKWGSVEPTRDTFNWTELDTTYNLAKSNGWPFRFHILVWGAQQPAWIESLPVAEQLEELKEWFGAVAARYPDIDWVEVANEPLHDPPGSPGGGGGNYLNALLAYDPSETGQWAWVINAFKLARFYFPNTPLMINEYGVENDGNMMPRYIEIIHQLQDRDLIDLVGVQGHAFNVNANSATLLSNINNLANSTGLPIQVTEFDVDGLDENFQASEYQRVFPLFWEHPSIMGITLWGYRPGHWRTAQGAPIVRANGSEEPSMIWLKSYVEGANPNLRALIQKWPRAQEKFVHETATFTATVRGNPAPAMQWQWSADDGATWVDVVDDAATFFGATTNTLVVSDLSAEFDGMWFRLHVENALGADDSRPALLTVNKFAATAALVELELEQTYDGSPKALTVNTDPPGLPVIITYNGSTTPPTNAGSYAVVATIDSPDYAGSVTGTLVIAPAVATVAFDDLVQPYDGMPKSPTITTTPAGLDVIVTYDGELDAPIYPGTYAVEATVDDPNYVGSGSATFHITITALVRHAPAFNGDVDGSVQVLLPESISLNSSAAVSGDLLVPGTPTVVLNGKPTYGGTLNGPGGATPTNYQVTLNKGSVLRHVVRRIDAIPMPVVDAPTAPAGTRDVTLNSAGQSPGNFATLRNLTLNSGAGLVAVPPGTYGTFTANGGSGFVLGIAGATEPAIFNLQGLALNNSAQIQIVGPVMLTVANTIYVNSATVGSAAHPEWLLLRIANGGLTLNSGAVFRGFVVAPSGTVTLNGVTLLGGVSSDRLVLNGNALLDQAEQ